MSIRSALLLSLSMTRCLVICVQSHGPSRYLCPRGSSHSVSCIQSSSSSYIHLITGCHITTHTFKVAMFNISDMDLSLSAVKGLILLILQLMQTPAARCLTTVVIRRLPGNSQICSPDSSWVVSVLDSCCFWQLHGH